ncbi:hypothetical protein [Nonomuraea sp. NPDC005650]|uniref:hypothetical protein n=1 Tax=Nonomuraea sp. NPDC005650 TaxID=3157045 RepID=UPI00339F4384
MADDQVRHETLLCSDCGATHDTPGAATFLYPKDGEVVVTEVHTRDCPSYLERWKPFVDDIERARQEEDNGGHHEE